MHEYYYTIIVEYSNQGTKRLDSFVTPFTNERTSQECRPRSACQDQIKRFENRFQRTFFAGNFIIIIIVVYTLWNRNFYFFFFVFFSETEAWLIYLSSCWEISGFYMEYRKEDVGNLSWKNYCILVYRKKCIQMYI